MADPSFALQVALFDRLAAEVSCPIYDSVPMDAPFPYVSLDYEIFQQRRPVGHPARYPAVLSVGLV